MIDKLVKIAAVACTSLISAVTFGISYNHLAHLARNAGEGELAEIWPLSVDLVLVASTLAMVSARRRGRRAGFWIWAALFAGVAVSLCGNVAAAAPDLVSRAVAAWTPVALALSIEVLVATLRRTDAPAASHTAGAQIHADGVAGPAGSPGAGSVIDTDSGGASHARLSRSRPGGRPRKADSSRRSRKVSPTDPTLIAKAAALLIENPDYGRPRLARELKITPYVARQVLGPARELAGASNGSGNGHVPIPEPGEQ